MGGAVLQVKAKYNGQLVELFREVFCHLPLAHCLNSRVLVVHGGLFSQDGVTLDDIRKVDRNMCAAPTAAPPLSPKSTGVRGFCILFSGRIWSTIQCNKLARRLVYWQLHRNPHLATKRCR